MSAMRMFAGTTFVNVDDPPVFGRCLPRCEVTGVNFYETASYRVGGLAPIVGAAVVVRQAESGHVVGG